MKIQSVRCVYFSPTGSTKEIAEHIAQGIGPESLDIVDITKRSNRDGHAMSDDADLVIIAVPVYYGRVPEEIVPYLTVMKADHTPSVLAVVYGNRSMDDALKELSDIAEGCGFVPVAAGAFVAEHSYSSSSCPIAPGRPDDGDLQMAREFGAAIRKKLQNLESTEQVPALAVPGQSPYVEPVNLNRIKKARSVVALTPETNPSKCTRCGHCAEICPTQAISTDDMTQTDRWPCLLCFACVKCCPQQARQMNEPNFQAAIEALQEKCQGRREPELLL